MRLILLLGAMLSVMAVLSVGVASPASADGFGLIKTDNNEVTFASDEDNNTDWGWWNHFVHFEQFDQYDARTDFRMIEQPRWGYNNATDIIWWAADLGTTTNGEEWCADYNWNRSRCDTAYVRFNQRLTQRVPDRMGWFLVCHEFGHAYGFSHYNNDCMFPVADPQNPPRDGVLAQHMINHINAQY